jgi:hypothetical protein
MYGDLSEGIPDGSAKSGVGFQNLRTKLEYMSEFLNKNLSIFVYFFL